MTDLKYGLTIPYVDPRRAAEMAREAEQAGWDGLFMGDAIWTLDPMIALAAAAMITTRLRLGTLVIPAPLRSPWKVASESLALDHLSGGRLTLGLGTGATWMGWRSFPDEVTDTKARAEMLGEMVDILTLFYRREPFDYNGQHYHLKLTEMEVMHYPPKPVQQPRIPLWIPGVWPRMKSMARVLKCDGLLPAKMDAEGKFVDVTPADVREMKAYITANRPPAETPFDIAVEGVSAGSPQQIADTHQSWREAGVTWWIESNWTRPEDEMLARLRLGPRGLGGA